MNNRIACIFFILGTGLTGLAFGVGGGGGSPAPPVQTNVWWPAGNVWFSSNGNTFGPNILNFVSVSEAWGTARLDALRRQASGPFNRHALEISWAWQGNANKVFTRCTSWTDMPDAYDDCGTAQTANPNDLSTGYSYGTYEVNNLIANRTYNGWLSFGIGGPITPYQGLELKNAFYHKSLYCGFRWQWSCGILDSQKEINRDFGQDRFYNYYGNNAGPYAYGQ